MHAAVYFSLLCVGAGWLCFCPVLQGQTKQSCMPVLSGAVPYLEGSLTRAGFVYWHYSLGALSD